MSYLKLIKRRTCLVDLLVFLLCCITVAQSDSSCCYNGTVHDYKTCEYNGNFYNVTLRCSLSGYLIDKIMDPYDFYTIVDSVMYLNNSDSTVEPDGYCIGQKPYPNGTLHEVAILCFPEPQSQPSIMVKGILTLISVAFLCATLYTYKIIPHLRETQDKVTIFCIICLAIDFTVLGLAQTVLNPELDSFKCNVQAYLIYFFTMSYFAWLNMVTANVLKVVVFSQWKIKERTWYILNHIYAWSISITLIVILMIVQNLEIHWHPGIGETSCWIVEHIQWLYFYIPLTVMISANLIQFVTIAVTLYRFPSGALSTSKRKALKYKCQLYFKLFILSGMSWIFEIFSYVFKKWENYWFITDAINALHGVLVFLILVIFRKRIRRELAGKRLCCCMIPQEWRRIDDSEDCGESEETKHDNINIRSQAAVDDVSGS